MKKGPEKLDDVSPNAAVDRKHGAGVSVFASKDSDIGSCQLKIKLIGAEVPFITYNAMIADLKTLEYRFNYLFAEDDGKVVGPTLWKPEKVEKMVVATNMMIRQLGFQLVPDISGQTGESTGTISNIKKAGKDEVWKNHWRIDGVPLEQLKLGRDELIAGVQYKAGEQNSLKGKVTFNVIIAAGVDAVGNVSAAGRIVYQGDGCKYENKLVKVKNEEGHGDTIQPIRFPRKDRICILLSDLGTYNLIPGAQTIAHELGHGMGLRHRTNSLTQHDGTKYYSGTIPHIKNRDSRNLNLMDSYHDCDLPQAFLVKDFSIEGEKL